MNIIGQEKRHDEDAWQRARMAYDDMMSMTTLSAGEINEMTNLYFTKLAQTPTDRAILDSFDLILQ